jgi:hypothetical protein
VREVLEAQRSVAEPPAVIVVTLDPWRDTPSRLSAIEARWGMEGDQWVATGCLGIERSRNARNSDLVHVPRVFLVVLRPIYSSI